MIIHFLMIFSNSLLSDRLNIKKKPISWLLFNSLVPFESHTSISHYLYLEFSEEIGETTIFQDDLLLPFASISFTDLSVKCKKCGFFFENSDLIDQFSHDIFDFFLLFIMNSYGCELCKWRI